MTRMRALLLTALLTASSIASTGERASFVAATAPAAPADAALLARLTQGKAPDGQLRTSSPRAYLACGGCHADAVDSFRASSHGVWPTMEKPVAGASCATCHGSLHEVAPAPERGTPEFRPYWVKLAK